MEKIRALLKIWVNKRVDIFIKNPMINQLATDALAKAPKKDLPIFPELGKHPSWV